MGRPFTVVRGVSRRAAWSGSAVAVALLLPVLFPAYHDEDAARVIDFASLHVGWFGGLEPAMYVPCWPVILAEQAAILLFGGLALTWMARRSRRASAGATP